MQTSMSNKMLSMLGAGLRLKCPRCSVVTSIGGPFSMNSYCYHCGLKFEREQGYFVGAIYINYAATVAIAVPGFFLLDTFHPDDDSPTANHLASVLGDLPLCFSIMQGAYGWCWTTCSTQQRVSTPCRQKNRLVFLPLTTNRRLCPTRRAGRRPR